MFSLCSYFPSTDPPSPPFIKTFISPPPPPCRQRSPFFRLPPPPASRKEGKKAREDGETAKSFFVQLIFLLRLLSPNRERESGGLLGGARQSPPFSLSSKSTPLSGPFFPSLPPIKRSLSPSLRRSSISLPPRPRSSFPKEGKTKVALSPPPPFLSPPVRKTPAPNKFPAKFPIRHEKERRGSRETSQFRNTARHSWIEKGGTLGWKERISLAAACGASEEDGGGGGNPLCWEAIRSSPGGKLVGEWAQGWIRRTCRRWHTQTTEVDLEE